MAVGVAADVAVPRLMPWTLSAEMVQKKNSSLAYAISHDGINLSKLNALGIKRGNSGRCRGRGRAWPIPWPSRGRGRCRGRGRGRGRGRAVAVAVRANIFCRGEGCPQTSRSPILLGMNTVARFSVFGGGGIFCC